MARLIWHKDAPSNSVTFELGETPVVVGRDPVCGVFIDAPLLSREHARIEFRGGEHVLIDLGSTNFTKVNGERIQEKALKGGDRVEFSRASCTYEA